MKKCIIIYFICISNLLISQTRIGINFGMNYVNLDNSQSKDVDFPYKYTFLYRGGFCGNTILNGKYNLNYGIFLSQRGGRAPGFFGFSNINYIWHTAELPIEIHRKIFNRAYLGMGIAISYYLSQAVILYDDRLFNSDVILSSRYELSKQFSFEASYRFCSFNVWIENREAYMFNSFNLSVNYRFIKL